MGKLVLLIIFFIVVLIFPLYENNKINIATNIHIKNKIAMANIIDGDFCVYDTNLSKKGNFKTLDIYKNYYISHKLTIKDILKNEKYYANKAILKNNILKSFNFKFESLKYNFISDYVVYNLKTKNITGKKFFLYSNDYNSTGNKFFIDANRNIKADNVSFYLKVNQ